MINAAVIGWDPIMPFLAEHLWRRFVRREL
jgi:hypothetical protein